MLLACEGTADNEVGVDGTCVWVIGGTHTENWLNHGA
jgi:hypothetical protein